MASLRSSVANASLNFASAIKKQKRTKNPKKETARILDDIDLDLYGPEMDEDEDEDSEDNDDDGEIGLTPGTNADVPLGDVDMEDVQSKAKTTMANPEGQSLQATHWCLIYRVDGALEVRLSCGRRQ